MSQYNAEQVFSLTKEAYDRGVVAGRKEINRVDTQKAHERGYEAGYTEACMKAFISGLDAKQ